MFAELMSYNYFLFWYCFIIAWFFLAAAVIYYVVIKDGFDAMKEKKQLRISDKQVSPIN